VTTLPTAPTPAELGRKSGAARRRQREAVRRLVAASRAAQGLPPTVTDVEVLERVADVLEAGARTSADAK
jgi:hypothetical protein